MMPVYHVEVLLIKTYTAVLSIIQHISTFLNSGIKPKKRLLTLHNRSSQYLVKDILITVNIFKQIGQFLNR